MKAAGVQKLPIEAKKKHEGVDLLKKVAQRPYISFLQFEKYCSKFWPTSYLPTSNYIPISNLYILPMYFAPVKKVLQLRRKINF